MKLPLLILPIFFCLSQNYSTYTVESGQHIKMFWKDNAGNVYRKFDKLADQNIVFAMNGGAYDENRKPIGLYIEKGKVITPVNKGKDGSNFSIHPNGIFYIDNNGIASICETEKFVNKNIQYANQSGPMLVIDGDISSAVKSKNNSYFIRNGVGILKDGSAIFAISKRKTTMYEFANFFKEIGCVNALYLDGGVSGCYPYKVRGNQNFGVIIGVVKKNHL